MIWALMKKDLRLNLTPICGALIFSLIPYALVVGFLLISPPEDRPVTSADYIAGTIGAGYACLFLMTLMSSAFGGMAFAAERRERTAEFLAMIPVSRSKIVTSKLIVAIGCLAIFFALHLIVLVACNVWAISSEQAHRFDADLVHHAMTSAAFMFVLFGVAWALSVFMQSTAIAASIAIVVGFAFAFGGTFWILKIARGINEERLIRESAAIEIAAGIGVFLTLLAVIFSSVRYARRVEP